MIEADKIEAISAADVRSSDDDKVGSVGQVFLDPATGRPEWAVVKTGIFGTKGAFVPLRNASWDGRVVRLAYDKDRVRNAPHVDPDERGLDPDQQVQLYTYYGFTEATPATDDRPSFTDPTPDDSAASTFDPTPDAPVSLSDTARAALSEESADRVTPTTSSTAPVGSTTPATPAPTGAPTGAPTVEPAVEPTPAAPVSLTDTAVAAMGDIDRASGSDATGSQTLGGDADTDDGTMTRMEEHLQVGVEPTATERVRLRKHVVTTQETVTVTIRREELRIERVPISADEARSIGSGTGIAESETDIVLYEERPVVTTVARPVERIRLTREVVAEEQTVTGDVRKERIEVEGGGIG